MMVSRKGDDGIEQCLAVVVHSNFEEGCLQKVAGIVLERIVMMRQTVPMIFQVRLDVPG